MKKIEDTIGVFLGRMGIIQDRKGYGHNRSRWQEYIDELYKKGRNDSDSHDGVLTDPELDILECEVKWVLGSISMNKASESDLILAELFKIIKDNSVKCYTQYFSIFGKQQWPQDWKRSIFIPIPKKGNAKECSNHCTITLIRHASNEMLNILQARLLQYAN